MTEKNEVTVLNKKLETRLGEVWDETENDANTFHARLLKRFPWYGSLGKKDSDGILSLAEWITDNAYALGYHHGKEDTNTKLVDRVAELFYENERLRGVGEERV